MSRVIAVQEEQLKMLKENYNNNVVVQNNANVLSDSLLQPAALATNVPINMESQSVNLNPFEVKPTISEVPVINNDVTSEVFGPQMNSDISGVTLSKVDTVPEVSSYAVNDTVSVPTGSNDLPYQEPVLNNNLASGNVLSDEAFVSYINSLRNMLSDFVNDMNSKLDKLQEEFLSKSGANLVNAEPEMVTPKEDPIQLNPLEMSSNTMNTSVTNIFDADKTFVTNDLRRDIQDARNELENSMTKA